jgi:hypothetical protein
MKYLTDPSLSTIFLEIENFLRQRVSKNTGNEIFDE